MAAVRTRDATSRAMPGGALTHSLVRHRRKKRLLRIATRSRCEKRQIIENLSCLDGTDRARVREPMRRAGFVLLAMTARALAQSPPEPVPVPEPVPTPTP